MIKLIIWVHYFFNIKRFRLLYKFDLAKIWIRLQTQKLTKFGCIVRRRVKRLYKLIFSAYKYPIFYILNSPSEWVRRLKSLACTPLCSSPSFVAARVRLSNVLKLWLSIFSGRWDFCTSFISILEFLAQKG